MKRIALMTMILALGACDTQSDTTVPDTVSVPVDYKMETMADATTEAQRKCGMSAKAAVFDHAEGGEYDRVAVYNCITFE